MRNDDAPPVVFVEFTNGAKDQFNVHRMTVKQINDRIDTVSKQLETKQSLKDAGLKFEDLKFNVKGT